MEWTLLAPLGAIVWIDLLLSGDNAVVIAMVCRTLPKGKQVAGLTLGTAGAIILRIAMSLAVAWLMAIEGLRMAGGLFLLVIAAKLIWAQDDEESGRTPATTLLAAVVAIAIADASMSLDNVMAIAALAKGDPVLMGLGVLLSIPLVIVGASIIKTVIDRFPWIVWLGAGLLGWVGGSLVTNDPFFERIVQGHETIQISTDMLVAVFAALSVLAVGAAHRLKVDQK